MKGRMKEIFPICLDSIDKYICVCCIQNNARHTCITGMEKTYRSADQNYARKLNMNNGNEMFYVRLNIQVHYSPHTFLIEKNIIFRYVHNRQMEVNTFKSDCKEVRNSQLLYIKAQKAAHVSFTSYKKETCSNLA